MAHLRARGSQDELESLWEKVRPMPLGKLLVAELEMEGTEGIREVGDRIRERLRTGIGLIAVGAGGKATLLAAVTDDLVKDHGVRADSIVREAAKLGGGSGGGRPHLAMAGIAEAGKIPAATMYATFNMGTGFCVIVQAARQQAAIAALKSAGEEPARVGWVTGRQGRTVSIPSAGLRSRGEAFEAVLAPGGTTPPGTPPLWGAARPPCPPGPPRTGGCPAPCPPGIRSRHGCP